MTFRLDGVTFTYPARHGRPAVTVLSNLSLTIPTGRAIAILGVSGLGKTTLLNLLALLWEKALPTGHIYYQNEDYNVLTPTRRQQLRTQEFGLVPQVSHFLSGFTCRQNLTIPAALAGLTAAEQKTRIDKVLGAAHLRLTDRQLDDFPVTLSTGERQRLSAVRGVMHDPAVIFADEPVSNLDGATRDELLKLFQCWRKGDLFLKKQNKARTLLLICHDLETAWRVAAEDDDQFLFLRPAPGGGARIHQRSRQQLLQDAPTLSGPELLIQQLKEEA